MAQKQPSKSRLWATVGAVFGFVLGGLGGMALWSFVGFYVALYSACRSAGCWGGWPTRRWANWRRAPDTPPESVQGFWIAAGVLALALLAMVGYTAWFHAHPG